MSQFIKEHNSPLLELVSEKSTPTKEVENSVSVDQDQLTEEEQEQPKTTDRHTMKSRRKNI